MTWWEFGLFFGGCLFAYGTVVLAAVVAAANRERLIRWLIRRAAGKIPPPSQPTPLVDDLAKQYRQK